jgi:hypothetical protein
MAAPGPLARREGRAPSSRASGRRLALSTLVPDRPVGTLAQRPQGAARRLPHSHLG